ncbi:MAG TPA: twin-arginine translocase TatA/TatE family subunit [Thermodesulfobacteriota bacterium]|jgi:sec-independent protein translocase protein TatA
MFGAFGGLGVWELLIILVILLLIFGPSKLGDLGTALGKGIRGFRKSMKEPDEIDVTPSKEETSQIEGTRLDAHSKVSEKKEEAK